MEEWKSLLESKLLKEIEGYEGHNQEILNDLKSITKIETLLKKYWQIRKNYNHISNVYGVLKRDVSGNYRKQHVKVSLEEIYYYETMMQKWRNNFPETNIRADYYIELAALEYNYFIENKYSMTKERREKLFLYSYKEDDIEEINMYIILNNLKHAQKLLEMKILWQNMNKDYDGLFLSHDIIGNLYICMYQLMNLIDKKHKYILSELILFSFLHFTLSYENKIINDEPEVYREGIIDLPYPNLFYQFFQKEGFNNYYSVERKLEFLQKFHQEKLKGTIITEKIEELHELESKLLIQKKSVSFYKRDKDFHLESQDPIISREDDIDRDIIYQHLKRKDDESDILDFKEIISDKIKIAKAICGFCNRNLLTNQNCYIVFGIRDRKNLPQDFNLIDRFIPLSDFLQKSKVASMEEFKKRINQVSKVHLEPNPDSCYTIKSLNLKDELKVDTNIEVIIIKFNKFMLDRPIKLKKDGYPYIRRQSETDRATPDEIVHLTKKIS